MQLLLMVSENINGMSGIRGLIPEEYVVLETDMGPKSWQYLRDLVSGAILVDTSSADADTWLRDARRSRPELIYVGVAGKDSPEQFNRSSYYDLLTPPYTEERIKTFFDRMWDKVQSQFSMGMQKKLGQSENLPVLPRESSAYKPKEHILREFSRALNNRFNRDRLLNLFLNIVTELVSLSNLSILLYDERTDDYTVFQQRGLDPDFCSRLRFKPFQGLIAWLLEYRRIVRVEEVAVISPGYHTETLQEMQLLKSSVCIPLMVYGQLIGSINLGPKVTGSPFHDEELEIIYSLSDNVAMALRDIELHHQILNQKVYIESILKHMNSGVISIGQDHTITTFNERAGAILDLHSEEVKGRDLRCLPSPLGDLLYNTLSTGKVFQKEEIELMKGNIPVEASTFRLVDDNRETLGSVLIFDDIRQRRQLELERHQAAQLDILNRFVGQLAHEVKNPMVAIKTFSELLPEKFDDDEFRRFFNETVLQEISRLNELVDQLIAFSTPLNYDFSIITINDIINDAVSLFLEQSYAGNIEVERFFGEAPATVRADQNLLARGFFYLLHYSFQLPQKGGKLVIQTSYDDQLFERGGICISFRDNMTVAKKEDVNKLFNLFFTPESGSISLGLSVSRKIIEDHGGKIQATVTGDNHLQIEVLIPILLMRGEKVG